MATLKVPAPLKRPLGTTISYVDSTGSLRIIFFDATLQDTHNGAAEVSFHPLDTNALVTDHVRASPRGLSIEAEVTNTPLLPYEGDGSVDSTLLVSYTTKKFISLANVSGGQSFFAPFAGSVRVVPVTFDPAQTEDVGQTGNLRTRQYPTAFDRVKDVWEALDALRDQGIAVQVVTRLHTYEEMVFTNVTAPHGIEDAIVFGLDLVEIRRADSAVIEVDPPVAEKRAQKAKTGGNQPTYEPTEQKQSAARASLTALANLVAQ